jgi:predicted Zn-dependent protease
MDQFAQALQAYRQGQPEWAARHLNSLLAREPRHVEALHLLGVIRFQAGAAAEAADLFARASQLRPGDAALRLKLATALRDAGRPAEAEAVLRKLLRRQPSSQARLQLAALCKEDGRLDEAARLYRLAADAEPGNPDARFNLGCVLMEQGDHAAAERALRQAIGLAPQDYQAWANLGECLLAQQRLDEAEQVLRKALAREPKIPKAWKMLAYISLTRNDEAGIEAAFRQGLAALPHDSRLELGLASFLLARERWQEAWQHYLYRNDYKTGQVSNMPGRITEWQGKTVVLRFDQGLGDELMFLRFLSRLKEQGARVAYYAPEKLVPILRGHPLIDRVIAEGEPFPAGDIGMMSSDLPLVLDIKQTEDIPPPFPLRAEAARKQELRACLQSFGPPPYIGVTWEGGRKGDDFGMYKLVEPASLGRLLKGVPGTIVVLQRNPERKDNEAFLAALERPALDMSALNDDLPGMLALLDELDDYLGVSNTNMHLRASLGKTARALLPHPAEWRWLAADKPTPWLPGFATYRQGLDLDWQPALDRLREDLLRLYGAAEEAAAEPQAVGRSPD